jgi:hypothetical protein
MAEAAPAIKLNTSQSDAASHQRLSLPTGLRTYAASEL